MKQKKINNSPIIHSIVHLKDFNQKGASKANEYVFDYARSTNPLISYPYYGLSTQQFSLILDKEGYYQILQNGQKFLRYDPSSTSLVGGPFIDKENNGFLLCSNDGTTCYAGPKKKLGGFSFDIEEDLRVKDHYGGSSPLNTNFSYSYSQYKGGASYGERKSSFQFYY